MTGWKSTEMSSKHKASKLVLVANDTSDPNSIWLLKTCIILFKATCAHTALLKTSNSKGWHWLTQKARKTIHRKKNICEKKLIPFMTGQKVVFHTLPLLFLVWQNLGYFWLHIWRLYQILDWAYIGNCWWGRGPHTHWQHAKITVLLTMINTDNTFT